MNRFDRIFCSLKIVYCQNIDSDAFLCAVVHLESLHFQIQTQLFFKESVFTFEENIFVYFLQMANA